MTTTHHAHAPDDQIPFADYVLVEVGEGDAVCVSCGTNSETRTAFAPGIRDRGLLCEQCAERRLPAFLSYFTEAMEALHSAALFCPQEHLMSLYVTAVAAKDFVFSPYLGIPDPGSASPVADAKN